MRGTPALRTPLVLVAVAGVMLIALVSAGGSSAVEVGPGFVPGLGSLPESPPEQQTDEEPEVPILVSAVAAAGFGLLLIVFIALVLLGLVTFIGGIRFGLRRRRRPKGTVHAEPDELGGVDGPTAANVLQRAARSALAELRQRSGGDPGDAVIAAWLVLEREAAAYGSARRAHQTPTEFTSAMLAEHRIGAAALDHLRSLYQRARFATGTSAVATVTEADVAAAEEALRQVVAELAGSAR